MLINRYTCFTKKKKKDIHITYDDITYLMQSDSEIQCNNDSYSLKYQSFTIPFVFCLLSYCFISSYIIFSSIDLINWFISSSTSSVAYYGYVYILVSNTCSKKFQ